MKLLHTVLFFVLLSTVIANSLFSQQDANGWYWLNGQPQGNDIKWLKMLDASNVFAVTARGQFMKSTDGGDTWSITQAGALNNTSSAGLSRSSLQTGWFFDANTGIVAGSPEFGSSIRSLVNKTTDGGLTWSFKEVNPFAGSTISDMYFINATTGFLCGGTNARAYKTTDAGETWNELSNAPTYSYNSVFAFDANKIFLTTAPRTLVKSTDGGNSWVEEVLTIAGASTTFNDIHFKDANTGYITGSPNFFAYTTNGGSTWTKSNSSSSYGQYRLAYENGIVWTAGAFQYVYKSSNNGMTWDSVKFYDNTNPNQPFSYYVYGLGVSGNDLIVAGTAGQITTSNDGGISWRNKNYSVDPLNVFYNSIYVGSPTGNVWVGTGTTDINTMLYSSNGGANWTSIPSGMTTPVFCFSFTTANTAYICGGNAFSFIGEMAKSTNGGLTWTSLALPSPMNSYLIEGLDFINNNTGWAVGSSAPNATLALVAKTTNGGATWAYQSLQDNPLTGAGAIRMFDENYGYLLSHTLYSTTNGGTNWLRSTNSTVTSKPWIDMKVLNKDVLFLCGPPSSGARLIIKSTDGGATWTDISSNLLNTTWMFKTDWLNPNDGVVSGTNGFCAITTNGGLSWAQTNPGFSTTVDVVLPTKNAWFTVSDRNGNYQVGRKYETNTTVTVNINAGIEGFWNGSSQVSDTVTLQLRSSASPFAVVATKKAKLTPGVSYGSFEFAGVPAGNYYLAVKHRNAVETWSASPLSVSAGGNYNYSFKTAPSQAYGSNMILKLGRYCLYSGDVNQDGIIDGTDASLVDNDALNFVSGYVSRDVDGNNFVDAGDASIVDNNAYAIVGVVRP